MILNTPIFPFPSPSPILDTLIFCWPLANNDSQHQTAAFIFDFPHLRLSLSKSALHHQSATTFNLPLSKKTSLMELPFGAEILPRPCLQSSCNECGLYHQSSRLCFGNGYIAVLSIEERVIGFCHSWNSRRLVGYCDEKDERLLVYECMKNGVVHDYLHDKNNVVKISSLINSWKMRIKIALDAARGIEYLHNYAVPPIKSSNILLDMNWTARVLDFRLSLMDPESDHNYKPMKAVGTVSYIDTEYYGLNVLTTKSDVYGLGVVMLELLT
ncbi:hypothetical protein Godav_009894, partial [Gossypium davidsonii]|nr:hypothetical protein [Gossypium davidsonii]